MTARSVFEIATGGIIAKARRTFQPVRRNSYNVGDREERFWTSFNPRHRGPLISAAEAYNRDRKEPGKRNGPLGHVALEVLREMTRLIDYKTGRLEPSIDHFVRKLKRSRDAVVRGMAALRDHGFLEWIRRTEPVDNPGEAGPQIKQATNAYRLLVPQSVRALFSRIFGKAPQPADDAHRRAEAAADTEAMKATLTNAEFAEATVCDPELAASLARVGALVDSANPPSGQNPGRVEPEV